MASNFQKFMATAEKHAVAGSSMVLCQEKVQIKYNQFSLFM